MAIGLTDNQDFRIEFREHTFCTMESDDLFLIRSALYVGNHERVQKEADMAIGLTDEQEVVRDSYIYRDEIARGRYAQVVKAVKANDAGPLQVLKIWAQAKLAKNQDERDLTLEDLKEWLEEPTLMDNPLFRVNAALVLLEGGQTTQALRLVQKGADLEELATSVQIYLSINRIPLAEKMVKQMKDIDDDAPITALATVWVNIAKRESPEEALLLIQEIRDKCGDSVDLLTLGAVCHLHMGTDDSLKTAFKQSKEAIQLCKEAGLPVPPSVMINCATAIRHLNKDMKGPGRTKIDQMMEELATTYPEHPYVKKIAELDELFTKGSSKF